MMLFTYLVQAVIAVILVTLFGLRVTARIFMASYFAMIVWLIYAF